VNCPRCEAPLRLRPIGGASVHECGACGGLFLSHGTVESIIADRGGSLIANELLASLPKAATSVMPKAGQRMYVKCPTCQTLMNRKLFATGAGIVIDVCKADGVFFDIGELPAIIEVVMNGGLESAARKDAARALEARRHAQTARTTAAIADARLSGTTALAGLDVVDAGGALADLLVSLFS
jgi:Zn-finger nucleic acid-binding protein